MKTSTSTLDIPEDSGPRRPSVRKVPVPFVRVLYSADMSRIGDVTQPALFVEGEQWVTFGRRTPDLVDARAADSRPRALNDPFISRKQFDIRWDRGQKMFRVRPQPKARRKLLYVDPAQNQSEPRLLQIKEEILLPPHSLLAVDKRALLLLCNAPWRPHIMDRMGLVGESGAVWRLRKEIASMARFKKPALVLGETGSGKELVARALCGQSPRSDGPFIALNCAALPEQLVESELFGHVKGAFTGASRDKPGVFQATHEGTLFLDEFGELPLTSQAKLLRVFEEGLITPVGSHESVEVDVRLVAATNRDPEEEMESGRLRKDLYYRISSHVIRVPPLAHRRWDIPLLFKHFFEAISADYPELERLWNSLEEPVATLPMSFFLSLLHHRWPGNVRELQNVVEQTARLNLDFGPFQCPDGPWNRQSGGEPTPPPRLARSGKSPSTSSGVRLNPAMGRASKKLGVAPKTVMKLLLHDDHMDLSLETLDTAALVEELRERLAQNLFDLMASQDFNQKRVAEHLEISRNTLARLIRTFRLPRPKDLTLDVLRDAWIESGHSIEGMAHQLHVSPRALKLHLTRTGALEQFDGPDQ